MSLERYRFVWLRSNSHKIGRIGKAKGIAHFDFVEWRFGISNESPGSFCGVIFSTRTLIDNHVMADNTPTPPKGTSTLRTSLILNLGNHCRCLTTGWFYMSNNAIDGSGFYFDMPSWSKYSVIELPYPSIKRSPLSYPSQLLRRKREHDAPWND